eukprot:3048258-Alexandrium_andersonii.AAC.1
MGARRPGGPRNIPLPRQRAWAPFTAAPSGASLITRAVRRPGDVLMHLRVAPRNRAPPAKRMP